MDGKHVMFNAPSSEGSTYFNYKGSHSLVLLGLVDANCKFLYVDVGRNGRLSDGGVFKNSSLYKAINHNKLNFPEEKALPGRNKKVPFVILTDAAFPLNHNIMKPFPFRHMTWPQRIFNYRLSRARRTVENAFGMLANRFRILLNKINLRPEKVRLITLTCVILHNYLITKTPAKYAEDVDKRFTFRYGLSQQSGNRPTNQSIHIRQEFLEYFNTVGAVSWQDDRA